MTPPHVPLKKIKALVSRLSHAYPDAGTELRYNTPIQFVVAAILSAQCTDKRVNIVTEPLFKIYKTASDFAQLAEEELGVHIRSCGLYKSKAKNIIACMKKIVHDFNGNIPCTRKELLALPGIGEKVANVILIELFHEPAFPVDTHVFRIARRLGLSHAKTPSGVEKDLTALFDKKVWIPLHHQIIFHGRRTCSARNPQFESCPLKEYCCQYADNGVPCRTAHTKSQKKSE